MRFVSATGRRRAGAAALVALGLVPWASARAQNGDDQVQLKARLVNIDVLVRDKKGEYVRDLTRDDFTVVENGTPQTVEFMDPPTGASVGEATSAATPAATTTAAPQRTAAPPRTFVSLLLDLQTTETTQLSSVAKGTERFIRERIGDTDAVAVFRVSNGLQMVQPFTRDKTKLLSAVSTGFTPNGLSTASESREVAATIKGAQDTLQSLGAAADATSVPDAKSNADAAAQVEAVVANRTLEQFVKLRSLLSAQQSRPVLAALAAICEAQRGIPGKKVLVLFSEGFVTASWQDWQVKRLVDIANRSNVAIFVIDSGGLNAELTGSGSYLPSSPLDSVSGAASQESRIRASGGENVFDNVRHEGINRNQDFLYRVSGDTGGAFLKNSNDVGRSLQRVDDELRARYTLGYYPTDSAFDGSFRKVKVTVRRPGLEVIARPGYFAIANDDMPFTPDETKLLAGFDRAVASPGMPVFADLAAFRTRGGRYVIPLALEVPPSKVKVEKAGEVRHLVIDVLGAVRASQTFVSRLGGVFDVRLDDAQLRSVQDNNIFFRQDVELDPGDYTLDLLVRDRLGGAVAGRRERIVLGPQTDELAMSGVVVSRTAVPGADPPDDVLSTGGVHIRPSASHEFRATDRLIVFFELYNATVPQGAARANALVKLTVLKDGAPVTKPVAYELADVTAEPVPHCTFAKFLSLTGLAPGTYTAAIDARDLTSGHSVKRDVSFKIVP